MKTIFITGILLLTTSALLSQVLETNPENIIIEYRDGKKIIRNKNDYKNSNPDSFHINYKDDFEREFMIKKDSEYICGNIIGKWKFSHAMRTNNSDVKYSEPQYYFFNPDYSFVLITGPDTSYGKWSYSIQSKGVIRVDYQEPKKVHVPDEIKKHLPSEFLKHLENIMNELFLLNDLSNETLTFFTIIPTEQKSLSDELYLRVIKITYNKVQ